MADAAAACPNETAASTASAITDRASRPSFFVVAGGGEAVDDAHVLQRRHVAAHRAAGPELTQQPAHDPRGSWSRPPHPPPECSSPPSSRPPLRETGPPPGPRARRSPSRRGP